MTDSQTCRNTYEDKGSDRPQCVNKHTASEQRERGGCPLEPHIQSVWPAGLSSIGKPSVHLNSRVSASR